MREHWLNADFDLSLRPRWRGLDPARVRQVRELEHHALGLAGAGDSVRVHELPGDELRDLLAAAGIGPPPLTLAPAVRHDARLAPFGWNAAAIELAGRAGRRADHPPSEVVRRVNARSFGAAVEGDLDDARWALDACRTVAELELALAAAVDLGHGWVAKAEHGNAALGNRRLPSRHLDDVDRRWAERVLEEDELVHLEPWTPRRLDLTASFEVDRRGASIGVAVHEVRATAAGAFVGALFGPSDRVAAGDWSPPMIEAAAEAASRLAAAGYFGPACLDGFVWEDRAGNPRIRVLADLNARGHVSAGGRALARRLDPDATALWRLLSTRRMSRFDTLGELVAALGEDAFDPARRRGVLPTSPLWLERDGNRRRAGRVALLLLAGGREEVLAMDDRVRARLRG